MESLRLLEKGREHAINYSYLEGWCPLLLCDLLHERCERFDFFGGPPIVTRHQSHVSLDLSQLLSASPSDHNP